MHPIAPSMSWDEKLQGDLIDPNGKLATTMREHAQRDRKPDSGVAVRFSRINAVDSGQGVVVQTVRSIKTGELLVSRTLPLADVEANGLDVSGWN
ncbi:hypothetical protein NU688_33210 [Variovorax sp. ZS18.2.2]|uniref:hypothetical protein n=1 Tax=Variovorax sp. ZS18.2.2 TaxID=2971255 RepID=UPI0021515396|nr:hypothetical protein [Variovorax sp. ZS18.2.2]MCR6481058.1 hypothetical protein [Variovorax sp. ZS18.2.2]